MPNRAVIGLQWGDEGKGKIVDNLAADADVVARCAGGANAGHTITIGDKRHALHLVPSGVLRHDVICLIGAGMVVDPTKLFEEIARVEEAGIETGGRIKIAANVHLVLPHHKLIDQFNEAKLGTKSIGTTKRGIGPAYADKVGRRGLRAIDLLNPDRLREQVTRVMSHWDDATGGYLEEQKCRADDVAASLLEFASRLEPMLVDGSRYLNEVMDLGRSVLIEGAQGTLLDVDYGTYPYTTSSNTTIGGALTGLGIGPSRIDSVIGVAKAYTTRVGNGPLPTELTDTVGDQLREAGGEYGTTTGRPRRCGWLDLVALRHAARLNGVQQLVITKLDVLDEFEELPVCSAYRGTHGESEHLPLDLTTLTDMQPVYRTLPGWQASTSGIARFDDLPPNARMYAQFVADYLGVELLLVSTGAERSATATVNGPIAVGA